ncbi:MAG: arsenate reductase (glutaredoxin) [Verrucomicrobiae bacterium]|nr:arsenate reductase (glutaredoxin) [Verrucomicrobiae bacterium]
MNEVILYHNPRCSKSRQALALLQSKGVTPTIREYLKAGLTSAEIEELISLLKIKPHGLLRTKEDPYKDLRLSEEITHFEVVKALTAHPILLERPIAISGQKAVIGRPPERVLEILSANPQIP